MADASEIDDWKKMRAITPRGYVCGRASTPIVVDGRLDDAAWQAASWSDDFVDIEGAARPNPRFRTRMKMLWDDQFLYVAAELDEPHVWGSITKKNEVIFHDNDFEMFIDPDGDNHNYHEFEINALGTIWELDLSKPYKDGGKLVNPSNLDGLLSAVHVRGTINDARDVDRGWSVEIALPWKALAKYNRDRATPPNPGEHWRINFSRVQWNHNVIEGKYVKVPNTREDNWVWSAQGIIDMHRPERWGYVQFSDRSKDLEPFVADPSLRDRDALMEVYHYQKEFFARHKRFAATLEELGLPGSTVTIELTSTGYAATSGKLRTREDSLIW